MKFLKEFKFGIHFAYHYLKRERHWDGREKKTPFLDDENCWYSTCHIVRHAGGGLNKYAYLNCVEAIKESVRISDQAVIELDFRKTYDDEVILLHDIKNVRISEEKNNKGNEVLKYADFMNLKIMGKYTPLDLKGLLGLLEEYKGINVIVDGNIEVMARIINSVRKIDEKILDRFIIQLYRYDDYEKIEKMYNFKNYIFTLYASGLYIWDFKEIVGFCLKYNIPVVTMPKEYVRNSNTLNIFTKYNIKVYAHTVNDIAQWEELQKMGVWGIYTDYLF